MDWMVMPLRHYAQFRGRSQRIEFWLFALFVTIGSLLFSALDAVLGTGGSWTAQSGPAAFGAGYAAGASVHGGILNGLFSLAMLIPSIAVSVRRLHDAGHSGWWLLLLFVPLIGWLVLFIFYLTDGTRGPNRFGPDPKGGWDDLRETFR